ncbi:MAG: hypothetical protein KatS3mg003_1788 [Candidatus Nitrosocaldaceae archaeon]|nr:MAG: hypothetical protein KatS3mg003_1788 [Candidatus Nitrosocaldaceae archaeon]
MKVLGIGIVLFLVMFINACANQTGSNETESRVITDNELYNRYLPLLAIIITIFIIIISIYIKIRKVDTKSSFDNLQFNDLENVSNNIQNLEY